MIQPLDEILDKIPIRFLRPFLPDRIAFYGHVVSDRFLPQRSRYRYPTFQEFEVFLDRTLALGYEFVPYPQFLAQDGRRKILLTFDDGFNEIFTELHPFLKERGIPYMVFILGASLRNHTFVMEPFSPGFIGRPGHLSRKALEKLIKDGVTIGYHTNTHFRITDEMSVDDPHLLDEILPRSEIETLLTHPMAFAYPFMAPVRYLEYDMILRNNGFQFLFDTKGLRDEDGPHIFRVPMDIALQQRSENGILFNLKRCLKSRLAASIRTLELV